MRGNRVNSLDVEEDLVNTLDSDLNLLKMKFGEEIDFTLTTQEYIDIDLDTSITHAKLSDKDIIAEVTCCQGEEWGEEDEIDDSGAFIKPGIEETRNAIEILEKFSVFARFGEDVMKALKDINRVADKEERCVKNKMLLQIISKYSNKKHKILSYSVPSILTFDPVFVQKFKK